jgi:hypothetical protein
MVLQPDEVKQYLILLQKHELQIYHNEPLLNLNIQKLVDIIIIQHGHGHHEAEHQTLI